MKHSPATWKTCSGCELSVGWKQEAILDPGTLALALRLGGLRLGGPGLPELMLAERILRHGLPQVLLLGGSEADLIAPLAAIEGLQQGGLELNLLAALVPGGPPRPALTAHRRRIGSLLCALDAGLSCFLGGPVLPRRLPGRLQAPEPFPLPPAPLSPLEGAQLMERLPRLDPEDIQRRFSRPIWTRVEQGWEIPLWPDVPIPAGSRILQEPLLVPTVSPVAEALRGALRAHAGGPVPFLPLDEDPERLLALNALTSAFGAFRGPVKAWEELFRRLAILQAPPHFCARC